MSKVRKVVALAKRGMKHPEKIFKAWKVLKREGSEGVRQRLKYQANYELLQKGNTDAIIESGGLFSSNLKFSILMPTYNVDVEWLEKAIQSVLNQTYLNWELCIADDFSTKAETIQYLKTIHEERIKITFLSKNQGISGATNEAAKLATGEYMVLMDNDDVLSGDALYEFAKCIKTENPDILYSDHDIINEFEVHYNPMFKPSWSPDLMLSQMYVGHLLGFRSKLFQEVGGFRGEFNGSQDYDLMLRMMEKAEKISHVEKVLYSWRALPSSTAVNPDSKPYAQIAGRKAIQEHLDRLYGKNQVYANETEDYYVYDVRYPIPEACKVSVIIPVRDHVELLKQLIESIEVRTDYDNYEIIVINNSSEEAETYSYFEELQKRENFRVVDAFCEFNWSRLNNIGIENACGDVFIFMNNDMKIISQDWMTRLVENAVRDTVGIVGGLLLYEDDTIQHAGVVVGMKGWADHVFKGMKPEHLSTPYVSPMVTRNVLAVTGACMAVSRKTIEKIGCFNEAFMICGSDVEICIRADHNGLNNIYIPYVKLYHFESKSRSSYIPQIDFKMSAETYKPYIGKDPFYNSQLDYYKCVPTVDYVKNPVYKPEGLAMNGNAYNIPEVVPYTFRMIEYPRKRMNLLVPSINNEHVFGGISTAFKFFDRLCDELGYDKRIILTDAEPHETEKIKFSPKYRFVDCEEISEEECQIVPYSNRYGRSLFVSTNDYFMLTSWWTAHCVQEAYQELERKQGIRPNKLIYFIQDYEPGFYPWSTQYLLADATYRCSYEQIAVFNTSLLKDYMNNLGHHFAKEISFEPVLNDGLKKALERIANRDIKKKKQIMVYGRPSTKRNAFELIVTALRKWVWMQEDVFEWKIIAAGEQFDNVDLGNEIQIETVGKLTIDEYAELLKESYAGISLMVSPHPSYPPMEMATFGVKVLTNVYANKQWKDFSDNVVVLDQVTPLFIAEKLCEVCGAYKEDLFLAIEDNAYINNIDVFDFVSEIKKEIEKLERI